MNQNLTAKMVEDLLDISKSSCGQAMTLFLGHRQFKVMREPYYKVAPQSDGYTIIEFFDYEREDEILAWFTEHGVDFPRTITSTYIHRTNDKNLVLLFKLMWGGAQ